MATNYKNHDELTVKQTSSLSNEKKEIISISAELRDFSNEFKHRPGIKTSALRSTMEPGSVFTLIETAFYGNGNMENNKGYVSIVFKCRMPVIFKKHHDFNFSCSVAVKDADGNKKLVRTFTFPYHVPAQVKSNNLEVEYTIDRYIARETLLKDYDDYLPEDMLTLLVDTSHQTISSFENPTDIEKCIKSSFKMDSDVIVLFLNSEVFKRLYEESSVFKDLCDPPMIQSSTESVHLYGDEKRALKNASRILLKAKHITFKSTEQVISLYIFADKYDIQAVIRSCRNFFKSILDFKRASRYKTLVKISFLATFFHDELLKEIVSRFRRNKIGKNAEARWQREYEKLNFRNLMHPSTKETIYMFDLENEIDEDRPALEFYN